MDNKKRILIVGDDPDHNSELADILHARGYEPISVTSGKDGLDIIKDKHPSLALIDVELADIPGIEVIKEIHLHFPQVICIAMIDYTSHASAIEAINQGAYSYIQKPYNLDQFLLTIRRALEFLQAQEELHLIETQYQIMTESMQDTVWLMDMEFRYLWVSPSVIRSLGYSSEELINQPLENYLSPVSAQLLVRQREEKLNPEDLANTQSNIILSGEYEFYCMNGSSYWSETVLTLSRDMEGKPSGFIGVGRDITERKKSEDTLKRERTLLRTLIDNLPVGIYAKDTECRKTLANRVEFDHVGAKTETEILGKTDWDLFPKELAEKYYKDDMTVIREGQPVINREEQLVDYKGNIRWIMTSKLPLRDENGQIIGLVGINLDITERKRNEEVITNLNYWFKGIMESSDSPIFSVDTKYCITSFNSRHAAIMKSLYGVDIELGKNILEYLPSNSDDILAKKYFDHALGGEQLTNEVVLGNDENSRLYYEATFNPIRNPQGQTIGIAVFVKNITQNKRAEEALLQSEEKLSKIFNTSPDAILLTTIPDGIIREANEPALSMYGYSQDEFLNHTTAELGAYVQPDARFQIYRKIAEQGFVRNFITQLIKKTGEVFWASISGNIADIGNEKCGVFILRDITQQKLLESRLYQSQKLESIGQLAAGIAHEINTPTQFVGDNIRFLQNGFTDLRNLLRTYQELCTINKERNTNPDLIARLEDKEKNIDLDYILTEIPLAIQQSLDGVHRIAEIVHAMKAFSHPGGESRVAVDINKAIQDTITVARNEWKYVATVETNYDQDISPIVCYPHELNQVFLNILVNAAHAISDVVGKNTGKQGKIIVTTKQDDDWVEIRIRDSGTGIPEKIRTKIFDPFFTTKEVGKGTGQGLAISYDVIVNKHKGTLSFETEMGKGTEFIIRLPNSVKE